MTTTPSLTHIDGKRFYEMWASASGKYPPGVWPSWQDLAGTDQERWCFLAKHVPIPSHDPKHFFKDIPDVQKYPSLVNAPSPDLMHWDMVNHPDPEPNPEPAPEPPSPPAPTRKWWQFWRST